MILFHIPGSPIDRPLEAHSVVQGDAQPMLELHPGPGWSPGLLAKHHHSVLQGGPDSQNDVCSWGPALGRLLGRRLLGRRLCDRSLPGLGAVPVVSRCTVIALDYFPMKGDYNKGH